MITNSTKSDKYTWQTEALSQWISHEEVDFLAECCVGSGKTTFAIKCVEKELASKDRCDFIIIVTVNTDVAEDFREKGIQFNINLTTEWSPGKKWPPAKLNQFNGIVITYSMLATHPKEVAAICDGRRTMAVLDEIHHLGEENSWGERSSDAFNKAVKRLGLSGTPFRSDKTKIPFVKFDEEGLSISDYKYRYNRGVTDEINRRTSFLHTDGKAMWEYKGTPITATFREELDKKGASQRLNTFLTTSGFMTVMLENALTHYDIKRKNNARASMIIFAIGCDHARWIVEILESMGRASTLIISEDADSYDKLKEFKANPGGIIVSVGMVSEGVNCPSLIVGVWATNIISLGKWWQGLGRIVRREDGYLNPEAVLIQPEDARLAKFAEDCMREQKIRAEINTGDDTPPTDDGHGEKPSKDAYTPISSEGYDGIAVIPNHDITHQLSPEKSRELANIQTMLTTQVPMHTLLEIDRLVGGLKLQNIHPQRQEPPRDIQKETELLRKEVIKLHQKYAKILYGAAVILSPDYMKAWNDAWRECFRNEGINKVEQCTVEQLKKLIKKFKELIGNLPKVKK